MTDAMLLSSPSRVARSPLSLSKFYRSHSQYTRESGFVSPIVTESDGNLFGPKPKVSSRKAAPDVADHEWNHRRRLFRKRLSAFLVDQKRSTPNAINSAPPS